VDSHRLKDLGAKLRDRLQGKPRLTVSDTGPTFASPRGHASTFPGPSEIGLDSYPPADTWDHWSEHDARAWPKQVERSYALVPTTCFNCESACGLLAYIDKETDQIRKIEGNPLHPGSRGRNCAKGPATLNQLTDPDRILHPLKRVGKRGEGKWQRVSWDEALDDIAARIRGDLQATGGRGVAYHVGRPGEDSFTNRVLQAWGVDGHNSHTNICSSNARAGYTFWMGMDRPSPDFSEADFILLVSAHLESGHYFNPHAQRIVEARARGAKVAAFDPRLSNTASGADIWLPSYPGSEAAVLLAIANHLIQERLYDRDFIRDWWNWERYLIDEHPELEPTFENFERLLGELYRDYGFGFAAAESGVRQDRIEEVARLVARAGKRFSSYNWRAAGAGNEGGWQVARCLMLLHALTGSLGTEGGLWPNSWNKFVPSPPLPAPGPKWWQDLHISEEYPLAFFEMSFLLPHFLKEGRGKLEVYFTRVYNPVWTNPDGFTWLEALTDEEKVGCHIALSPTWSETAWFADYVLPMGHATERHDLQSQETSRAQWLGFRQPVMREYFERTGKPFTDTRDVNPGEVWEENEFWLELSWRIDPDNALDIRRYFEKLGHPGEKMTVDDYYRHIFEQSVPGLPEAASAEGLTPLQYMRRYGAFEVTHEPSAKYLETVGQDELEDMALESGLVYSSSAKGGYGPQADPDPEGRKAVGVVTDGVVRRGWPTPSGKLEFYSTTLRDWGWPEYALPTYIKSHVHPENLRAGEMVLLPNFRLPVQIHTRSANSKWLDEIAHTNPLWVHPKKAHELGVATGDLIRVNTRIGYFVVKTWVTEGIRPDIVACSHHFGRWRLDADQGGNRALSNLVALDQQGSQWSMHKQRGVTPFPSSDPDTSRIWWSDVGVHQNITFEVHPDPISGMHCWHQAVRIEKARADDRHGDVGVDTEQAHNSFREWLAKTRKASRHSPDGTRRPYWLPRPLKPSREAYRLPEAGKSKVTKRE
jgi:anaerobic selenocysteine-containing dehydrogenase